MSDYGVSDLTPADGRARLTTAMGGQSWQGRHAGHAPAFTGHPIGVPDISIGPELDQLANVNEAPASIPPGVPDTGSLTEYGRAELLAALAALGLSVDDA